VEDVCPGLPDWHALKTVLARIKNCAAIFQRPDLKGNGVYFAGPWEKLAV
jgi:glycine betaine/proline transport system substrate-binding protein